MICQNCQKRTANVHFTQVVNNTKVEMYLCEQCAKEKGQLNIGSPFTYSDFFSGVMNFNPGAQYYAKPQCQPVCDKCGMSFEEFQRQGKLGCSNCYELFGDRLDPLLKRLHGNTGHTGKVPASVSKSLRKSKEIEELKELLNKAVQSEEYEKAAEIRDRIKMLEAAKTN